MSKRTTPTRPPIKYQVSSLNLPPASVDHASAVIASGNLTQGSKVGQLEKMVASRLPHPVPSENVVACNSGTSALHLALLAIGVGPGDTVMLPAFTYVATRNAVLYTGAHPLYYDVDPYTWTATAATLDAVFNTMQWGDEGPIIKAVVLVHMYSAVVDLDSCMSVIFRHCGPDTHVVVDAAHTAPVALRGTHELLSPQLIAATTYSFYASKIIGCGEGGMVVFNSDDHASTARLYRGQGTIRGSYDHQVTGYNYRMTDVSAALVIEQLDSVDRFVGERSAVTDTYRKKLSSVYGVVLQTYCLFESYHWMFAMLLPVDVPVDEFRTYLLNHGVETRQFFTPMHMLQTGDDASVCEVAPSLPVSEQLHERGVCLPTHTGITVEDACNIADIVRAAINDIQEGRR